MAMAVKRCLRFSGHTKVIKLLLSYLLLIIMFIKNGIFIPRVFIYRFIKKVKLENFADDNTIKVWQSY